MRPFVCSAAHVMAFVSIHDLAEVAHIILELDQDELVSVGNTADMSRFAPDALVSNVIFADLLIRALRQASLRLYTCEA